MFELIKNLIQTRDVYISTLKNSSSKSSSIVTKSGYVFNIRNSSIVHLCGGFEYVVLFNNFFGLNYKNKKFVHNDGYGEDVQVMYDVNGARVIKYTKDTPEDEVFQYEVLYGFNVLELYDTVEFLCSNNIYASFDSFKNNLTPEENLRELNEAMYLAIKDIVENEIN